MTASGIFGLNFLRPADGGGSAPIVGDYDPRSQTWGEIVTAQSAGGCASECYNCCGNTTGSTTYDTQHTTTWTTYNATDVETTRPGGGVDYTSDSATDSGTEGDIDWD
jgi:hypothetical protein